MTGLIILVSIIAIFLNLIILMIHIKSGMK